MLLCIYDPKLNFIKIIVLTTCKVKRITRILKELRSNAAENVFFFFYYCYLAGFYKTIRWDRWQAGKEHTEGDPSDVTLVYFRTTWEHNMWKLSFILNICFLSSPETSKHSSVFVPFLGLSHLYNSLAVDHVYIIIPCAYTGSHLLCDSEHISWPEGISLLLSVQGSTEPTWYTPRQDIYPMVNTHWSRAVGGKSWPCLYDLKQKTQMWSISEW